MTLKANPARSDAPAELAGPTGEAPWARLFFSRAFAGRGFLGHDCRDGAGRRPEAFASENHLSRTCSRFATDPRKVMFRARMAVLLLSAGLCGCI
ncbi:MAG TPA: hypothetical protein VKD72_04380, partial [Gemmataceae bacterium]|nr:hypothetical protein [Gemmataceae bacterium]